MTPAVIIVAYSSSLLYIKPKKEFINSDHNFIKGTGHFYETLFVGGSLPGNDHYKIYAFIDESVFRPKKMYSYACASVVFFLLA